MKYRVPVIIFLLASSALLATGCASLKAIFAQPNWSENYALDGDCDVTQLNDGSMYTTGKTHPPEYVKGEPIDDSRFNDAIVTLRSPKEIRRIVVRRRAEDAVPVDIDLYAMIDEDWKLLKEIRGEVKEDIEARIRPVETDKIKVRVQRATRTAKGKSAVAVTSGRAGTSGRRSSAEMDRVLREPVLLAEIELYGLKPEKEQAEKK